MNESLSGDAVLNPTVKSFFDPATFTASYVISEPGGPAAAIIDSVLDYDAKAGRTSTASADRLIEYVQDNSLTLTYILETHAHADHLTAAPYLRKKLGGEVGIGAGIIDVQSAFKPVFNCEPEFTADGSQFERLFEDGDVFQVGGLSVRVMHTPGHTPACVTYVVGDAAFVGDTLFMPDYGTARTDFPGGDAATLFRSIHRVLSLPDSTRLFMCHDYMAPGRDEFAWETTVSAEREENIHVGRGATESEFVALRTQRDKTLDMPALLLPSVQVNMRAGHLPPPEDNGVSFLKIPLNKL